MLPLRPLPRPSTDHFATDVTNHLLIQDVDVSAD